ncbi:MAG TPA: MBL fold metallo-hydrolase [Gemmatimonadaceae bacterium]|nr:MBL fold metallo-hydrolase [Gemmatimonadaceae bacterium]
MRPLALRAVAVAAALFPLALDAQGSPALEAAAKAMGGRDRILGVRTLSLEGRADQLNFGQNNTPTADTKFEVTSFKLVLDFANKRWFQDITREPRFVTAVTAPQRQRNGIDGDVAYNVAPNGNMTRAGAQVATERSWEFLFHPIGFMQAALAPGAEVFDDPAPNNTRIIRITPGGNKFAMIVDTRTSLPVRVERMMDQAMLGDVTLIIEFSDWQDVGGMKMPMRFTRRYENLATLVDVRLTAAKANEDVGNIAASDSIRSATVAQAAQPAPTIVVDTLAPGVWLIGGQTHHTIAIEQSKGIVLVEAPQSDARALAAIAKARELRPNKPLTAVINTHHHFDHSGGIRAAVSEGLPIITHEANKDFYERVVYRRPHLIQPDALSKNPKPLRLTAVRDKYVLRDSARTVEVYEVTGNPHAGTMLMVYLPAEKILVQADLYNPPAANAPPPPWFPFAANLVENIQKRGLQVERVVGIHGRPVPFTELLTAAATRAP